MDFHRARRFITAAILLLAPVAAAARTVDGNLIGNLIGYGMGGFGDGGVGPPMLDPAEVKIDADRRIVFGDQEGVWEGRVEPRRLERLKLDLAKDALLRTSRLIPVRSGGLISLHGGMASIRYRDGHDEVVIAVLRHPRRGSYVRLIERIGAEIPNQYSRFRPKALTLRLYPSHAWREPVPWPFSATTPLAGRTSSDSITVTDSAAVGFIIDHAMLHLQGSAPP